MNTRFVLLATAAATLAACSSIPDRNSALDQARGRLNSAQSNQQVVSLAPDELQRAGESLRVAEQAWTSGGSTATVDHLAYMTVQRVTIAQESASSRASQAITEGAAAERDKMRLAMRTSEADKAQGEADKAKREADTARQQLALSQQSNVQKTAELAAADATAVNEKARMARSDAQVSDLERQLKDLNAKKTDRGIVVTLGDVLFDSGQSRLLPAGSRNMARLADFFNRNPERKASIEGNTDSIGAAAANHDLSERRANAVMTALVKLGVPADRLSTRAHGEDNPVADNDTAAGRQMNRRVEIVFPTQGEDIAKK